MPPTTFIVPLLQLAQCALIVPDLADRLGIAVSVLLSVRTHDARYPHLVRCLDYFIEQLSNYLVADGSDADFPTRSDEFTDHARSRERLPRARRALDRQYRIIESEAQLARQINDILSLRECHRLSLCQAGDVPEQEIPRRPVFARRVDAVRDNPVGQTKDGIRLLMVP